MKFKVIMTAFALAVVLYLQFCFDFKSVIKTDSSTNGTSEAGQPTTASTSTQSDAQPVAPQ